MEAANSLRNAANFADGFVNLLKHSPGGAPVNINPAALANVLGDAANQIHTTTPEVKRGRKKKDAVPEGAEGEEGGKKKRKRGEKKEKVPRDPNAPKRPPSAYLLFQNEVRKEMMTKFPSMTYREVLAEISKVWTAMSEDDKAVRTTQSYRSSQRQHKSEWRARSRIVVRGGGSCSPPSSCGTFYHGPQQPCTRLISGIGETGVKEEGISSGSGSGASEGCGGIEAACGAACAGGDLG
ncbi:hypothetical protein BD410DRAFT_779406 [Rickenella mellea]|uniref:HMG box domain-containing protein n=1 Tax=Rickenella mellea TaxID=50990 RepID=A0A4R5XG30_9AGAM|nr:hypothetical protein BD410DRAFT_779406 [Rickenella mellea]